MAPIEEEFDFSDLEDNNTKNTNKKQSINKKNAHNMQQFYYIRKGKDSDFQFDEIQPKQSITLPPINNNKPNENNINKKVEKNKMNLGLQQLITEKKTNKFPSTNLAIKKQSQEYDFAVYGQQNRFNTKLQVKVEKKVQVKKTQPIKQEAAAKQTKIKQTKINQPQVSIVQVKKFISPQLKQLLKNTQKQKQKDLSKSYAEQVYQQVFQSSQKYKVQQQKIIKQTKKVQIIKKVQSSKQKITKKVQLTQQKITKEVQSQQKIIKKVQSRQDKISKYKQLVQKQFPQQSIQKVQKQKSQAINKQNDKIREMIKGFSSQLTILIDKNLLLLKRNENQISQQIQGQDPLQTKINLLEEMKKNNFKMLENTQSQLDSLVKITNKIKSTGDGNVHITEEIQAHKKCIASTNREINNIKNQVQKQGKKVTKMSNPTSQGDQVDPKLKNNIEIRQKLGSTRIDFDKNGRKIQQLDDKIYELQTKITQTSQKKNQILQKAAKIGIAFYSKQDKKKYQELKKKQQQLSLFASKFNASIKSKQTLIKYSMTQIETIIYDFEQKYEKIDDEIQSIKDKIFKQIKSAKKNPKLTQNIKQVLTQLQLYMSQNNDASSEGKVSSLNFLSDKIYKIDYHANKTRTQSQVPVKQVKVAYKNYIQQISRTQQQVKNRKNIQSKTNDKVILNKRSITPSQKQVNQAQVTQVQRKPITQQKQNQRVWKQSNSQNPFKNHSNRQTLHNQTENLRYKKNDQNPLNNKEIVKLIDRNKDKVSLSVRQEEKLIINQANNKKPFSFRSSQKDVKINQDEIKLQQIKHKINQITQNASENIKKNIQKISFGIQKTYTNDLISIKLQDKSSQPSISLNQSPFRKILRKEKPNVQNTNDPIVNVPKQTQRSNKMQQNIQIPNKIQIQQEQSSFKPKRFNLRKKNEGTQQQEYMPTSQKNIFKEQSIQIKHQSVKKAVESNQPQGYNPFKKFIGNADNQERSYQITTQSPSKLQLPQQKSTNFINLSKPKINLFKKQQTDTRTQIKLNEHQKPIKLNENQKSKQQTQQINEPIHRQVRQGRLKKAKAGFANVSKNIYDNIDDMTQNNNILSLGQSSKIQLNIRGNIESNKYNDSQPNLNDLLGIKANIKVSIDKDLLIDGNKQSLNKPIKRRSNQKADFFADLQI